MPLTITYPSSGSGIFQPYGLDCASDSTHIMMYSYFSSGFVYTSTDSGYTWTKTSFSAYYLQNISVSPTGAFAFVTGGASTCYVTTNFGNSWTSKSLPTSQIPGPDGVKCYDNGTIYMTMGYNDYVYKSTNGGTTWTTIYSTPGNWKGIFLSSDKNTIIIYENSVKSYYLLSSNAGNTWTQKNISIDTTGVITNIACSSDLTNMAVVMYSSSLYKLYVSTDSGNTWTSKGNLVGGPDMVESTSSLSLLTFIYGDTIYYSTNLGSSFNTIKPSNTVNVSSCRPLANGSSILFTLGSTGELGIISGFTTLPTITINGTTVASGGTYTALARTQTVTVVATPTDSRTVSSVTGTTNLRDDLNTITITMSGGGTYTVYVMVLRNCFKEDTKILCYIDNEEQYIPIQTMQKGTLVKTLVNGYVPVHSIGHSKMYNPANDLRGRNRLYKCTQENYPEITEDLIITGCHSVLVDNDRITPEIKKKTSELTRDDVWLTDNKFRLLACLDERAETYQEEGVFTIWHFALEHFDEYMNYGIYANGLLVESCDINMMREYSGLELLE